MGKLSIFQIVILIVVIGIPLVSMAVYFIVRAAMDAINDSRLRIRRKFLLQREEADCEKK